MHVHVHMLCTASIPTIRKLLDMALGYRETTYTAE